MYDHLNEKEFDFVVFKSWNYDSDLDNADQLLT